MRLTTQLELHPDWKKAHNVHQRKCSFSSVHFSHSVVSNSLWLHGLQHTKPPCPSPMPSLPKRMSTESLMPSSHLILYPPLLLLAPMSPSLRVFPMSQLFTWGGQSTGVSALASVLPKQSQGWSPSEWTGWISLQSKGLSRVFSNTTVRIKKSFS